MASSDNFNRADEGPPAHSWWTDDKGGSYVSSNKCGIRDDTGGYGFSHRNDDTPTGDHWAEVLYVNSGGADQCGPWIRCVTGASPSGYIGMARVDLARIYRVDNLSFNQLADYGTFAANDIIRIEAVGSTLTLYKNGTSMGNTSDSTYGSSNTTYGFFQLAVGGGVIPMIDNWAGGNSGGSGPTLPPMRLLMGVGK